MNRLVVLCSIATLLLVTFPAAAQNSPGDRRFGQGSRVRQPPPQRVPARDATGEDRKARRDVRMTPEQRQQLRRDIHDHGRDIYRDRGDAGRRR